MSVCILAMMFISACSVLLINDVREEMSVEASINEASINDYNEIEIKDTENVNANINKIEEQPSVEELMVSFDVEKRFDYISNISCVISENKEEILFGFDFHEGIPESDDDNVYLFEYSIYENESEAITVEDKLPIINCKKDETVILAIPYEERFLFSRFVPAILVGTKYETLSNGLYASNPEALADNTEEYPDVGSKKGILLDSNTINTDMLYDLNVKRAVYNIPLSLIIGESDNTVFPTIEYEYNGEIYSFNGYYVAGYDSLFSYLTNHGFHSTAIILNDWNKKYPEIIHPKSRKRTGGSLYYAFNTEEEAGVRLMEATAMFLAERYSGGDYGMVHDWVIANEINQQTIWNYMATADIDYYAESFEKSFRVFYNAIRANYSNAKVYFSIDHDWNDNNGNNYRFFNGRELLYKFNEYALKGGNYDWNLSIHPYPAPLTRVRFWRGEFDKTENARVITPMNLSALTDVMRKDEMLNTAGRVRDIAVTELGFSSKAGEKLQAAAFAYCYYIIDNNDYISSFLLNRQTDDAEALKSGLALGIYNNDYSAKYIKNVFSNIDSDNGNDYISEMLEIIGASSLEQALEWAR